MFTTEETQAYDICRKQLEETQEKVVALEQSIIQAHKELIREKTRIYKLQSLLSFYTSSIEWIDFIVRDAYKRETSTNWLIKQLCKIKLHFWRYNPVRLKMHTVGENSIIINTKRHRYCRYCNTSQEL